MNSPVKSNWARRIWFSAAVGLTAVALGAYCVENGAAKPMVCTSFSSAPLCFEANAGQSEGGAPFIARGAACSVLLSADEAEIILGQGMERTVPHQQPMARTVRFRLAGANRAAKITGRDEMAARANYFIGNDPSQWHAGVPLFSQVQVDDVYPGVRVVYYANQSAQLEYDFLLQARAKPEQIRFCIEGADEVQVDREGNLVLKIGGQEICQHQPVAYQDIGGVRKGVKVAYCLNKNGTVGLALGDYDRDLPLVIDPVLDFLTYLAGKSLDIGWAITLQGTNIYVTGETLSKNLATTNAILGTTNTILFTNAAGGVTNFGVFQGGTPAFGDAFVASYSTNGSLNYLSYLGGRKDDGALAIAGDGSGGVWLTGFTDSTNFPIMNGVILGTNMFFSELTGPNNNAKGIFPANAFITHLDSTGSSILFSTYFGGEEIDEGTGIAVDSNGNVFVTGLTSSTNLPVTPNVVQSTNRGNFDAFVTELSPSGTNTFDYTNSYTTYFGGTNTDFGLAIALDPGGNAWITGITFSTNFETANISALSNAYFGNLQSLGTNAVETNHLFGDLNSQTNSHRFNSSFHSDGFVTAFMPFGTNLLFSTLLGGSNDDAGVRLAIDSSSDVFVTGYTLSRNFPTNVVPGLTFTDFPSDTNVFPNSTANAFPNATTNFISHAFVTELTNTTEGYVIGASATLGGNSADRGTGIGLDDNGNVYVIGSAGSTNFFQTNVVIFTNAPPPPERNKHGAITNFFGIMTNNFTFTSLSSTNFTGHVQRSSGNTNDIFIAVLSPGLTNFVHSIILGGPGDDEANGIAVDKSGSAVYFVGATTSKTNFATTNAVQQSFPRGNRTHAFVGGISLP
jgi:hypothetical protein